MWLLLCTGIATGADASVLMLGNSYTLSNSLAGQLRSQLEAGVPAYTLVDVEREAAGGRRFTDHLAEADGSRGATRTRDLLVTGGYSWDWVILQEQSQIPGFPSWDPTLRASEAALVDLDDLVEANGAETVLFMTWGRRNGDSSNPALYPDFETMNDRILDGYLQYAAAASTAVRPVWIAPVGLAFAQVHADASAVGDPLAPGSDFARLYRPDGSHPSAWGSFLASAVQFATLTGREATGVGVGMGMVGDEAYRAYLETVADTVVLGNPYGVVPLPWAWRWADLGGAGAVGGAGMRPLVLVDVAASPLPTFSIGSWDAGQGAPGDARVLVAPTGSLDVGTLSVGPSGTGELRVQGRVDAATVLLGGGVSGSVHVDGGALHTVEVRGAGTLELTSGTLAGVTALDPALVQEGGTLAPGGGLTATALDLRPSGRIALDPGDFAALSGAALLAGTLHLTGFDDPSGRALVLSAASIDATGLTVDSGGDHAAAVVDVLGVPHLELTWSSPGPVAAVSGTCGGDVDLTLSGFAPGASAAVLLGAAREEGPLDACPGGWTGLAAPAQVGVLAVDGAGSASATIAVPAATCGQWFQVVDLSTCHATAVQAVP